MVQVSQPRLINQYNKDMGGVDPADQNISCYRISIRSRKWWWSLFAWTIDMVVQYGWLSYQQFKNPDQPPLDLLGFPWEIVSVGFSKFCSARATAVWLRGTIPPAAKRVRADVHYDYKDHYQERSLIQKRCGQCGKNTRKQYRKCQIGWQDHYFEDWDGY